MHKKVKTLWQHGRKKETTFQRPGNIDAQPLVHTQDKHSVPFGAHWLFYVALGLARTM